MKRPHTDYAPKGIELTGEELEKLHRQLDRTRRTSTTVTVDRQALTRLLADHSRLYAALDEIERAYRHAEVM